MIVALIGNDGSGKTSAAAALAKRLGTRRKVRLMGEFEYPLLGLLRKLQGSNTSPSQDLPDKDHRPSLAVKALPYIMWLDTCAQTFWLRLFRRGTVNIKDRCAYDYLATWRELGVASKSVEFLYRIAPKPDVTFYLSVDPVTSLARRKLQPEKDSGKTLAFYKLKKGLYEAIYTPNRILRIDNNGPAGQAVGEIVRYIELRQKIIKTKVIAISGLDGAGKTTTIDNLSELLTRLNIRHQTMHFYYNYLLLKPLAWMKRSKPTGTGSKTDVQAAHQKSIDHEKSSVAAGGKSKLWVAFVLSDALLQYGLMRLFSFRKVLIFDRFFPDYIVSFDFLGVRYNKELLLKSFPRPKRYYLQIADYKVLYARKPEHTLEFFERCYKHYRRLAKEQGMILLDSTRQNPQQITKRLLEHL